MAAAASAPMVPMLSVAQIAAIGVATAGMTAAATVGLVAAGGVSVAVAARGAPVAEAEVTGAGPGLAIILNETDAPTSSEPSWWAMNPQSSRRWSRRSGRQGDPR